MTDASLTAPPRTHLESAPPGPSDIELPPSLAVRYTAVARIGGGAVESVRAHDRVLHRDVSIKVFRRSQPTAHRTPWQAREASLLASISHPALTTIYDAGTDRSDPDDPFTYLISEHLPQPDLRTLLQTRTLSVEEVCWLGADLGDALACLHEAGFLHRGLHPATVVLTGDGATLRPRGKLTDFGLAALIGHDPTADGYLSPEESEHLPQTEASDVYALGRTLADALTGTRRAPDTAAREPEHAEQRRPELLALLDTMTSRCPSSRPTAADAAERFRDVATARLLPPRQDLPDPAVDEAARLATVRRYQILDTPPEDVFDDVTALAAQILHAPTALVAITDRDRIWFKSRHDFTEPQLDRNTGLGELLHPGTRPWTIPDTTSGSHTSSTLHGEEPRARGIAAAPLRTHDGHTIGALCVLDPAPHVFTTEDLALLTRLAAVVIRELELRLACRRAVFNRRAPDPTPYPSPAGRR